MNIFGLFLNAALAVATEGNLPVLPAVASVLAMIRRSLLVYIKWLVPVVGTAGVIGLPAASNFVYVSGGLFQIFSRLPDFAVPAAH